MRIETHRQYEKAWTKRTPKQRQWALAAIKMFLLEAAHPQLRLHQLKGDYYPQYTISAGGDLRIHFLRKDESTIVLMLIGTHAQLYG